MTKNSDYKALFALIALLAGVMAFATFMFQLGANAEHRASIQARSIK